MLCNFDYESRSLYCGILHMIFSGYIQTTTRQEDSIFNDSKNTFRHVRINEAKSFSGNLPIQFAHQFFIVNPRFADPVIQNVHPI